MRRARRTKKKMKKTTAVRNKNGLPKKESAVLARKVRQRKAHSQRKIVVETKQTMTKRTMKAARKTRMAAKLKRMKIRLKR